MSGTGFGGTGHTGSGKKHWSARFVPHSPAEHADDPSEQVTHASPQSAATAQLVPKKQHDRHWGATQRPSSEHHDSPAPQTPGHACNWY